MKKFLESISKAILLFFGIFWDRILLFIEYLGAMRNKVPQLEVRQKIIEFHPWSGGYLLFFQIILFIIGLFVIFTKKISPKLKIIIITIIILLCAILTMYYGSQKTGYYTEKVIYDWEFFDNWQFTRYAGIQEAASIEALMTAVVRSNRTFPEMPIIVKKDGVISTPNDIQSAVNSRNTYTVEFEYNSEGCISIINVTGF